MQSLETTEITCPHCGKPTDSMKMYYSVYFALFLLFFLYSKRGYHVACPRCMREYLIIRLLINLIPANILWLLFILPWHIILIFSSFSKGHSKKVHGLIQQEETRILQRELTKCPSCGNNEITSFDKACPECHFSFDNQIE